MKFREDQLRRYRRHLMLPEIGERGQQSLLEAKVLIVGAGGLGSPVGYYLAAAGIGSLTLVDDDVVDLGNLQRQIAHSTQNIGMSKVGSAKKTFEALNPDVRVVPVKERLTKDNVLGLIKDCDIVADCSDNFETRFLINDACIMSRKPLVTGAVSRFEGQLTVVIPNEGPCYRCLFEKPPTDALVSPEDAGPIGTLPGVIGSLQAAEILKLVIGAGHILKGELLIYEALTPSFRRVKIPRDPDCPACGQNVRQT